MLRSLFRIACVAAAGSLLVSCASIRSTFSSAADTVSGAFARAKPAVMPGHDAPPDNAPADAESVADAIPRDEPLHPTANRPLAGQGGHDASGALVGAFSQRGRAVWYGKRHQGNTTASDEKFDPLAMTAAHPRLPIPSYARVANVRTTRSVIVRINDRGPADGSVIALSYAAAAKLGIATPEGGDVEVTRIMPDEYAALQAEAQALVVQRAVGPAAAPVRAPAPAPSSAAAALPATTPVPAASAAAPVVPVSPPPASSAAPAVSPSPAADSAARKPAPASSPTEVTRVPPPRPIAGSKARPPKIAGDEAPATGRWAIQVGVFAVPENAETVRRQVATQLAQAMSDAPLVERTPRVELRGNRHFVLVGDAPDRASAEALAARVKRAVKHDVVIVRR